MSKVPDFDNPDFDAKNPVFRWDEDVKASKPHARTEGKPKSDYVCKLCKKDCGNPGGLGSHMKFEHTVEAQKELEKDLVIIYAKLGDHKKVKRIKEKKKDIDFWVSEGVKIPEGYEIYSINPNPVSIVEDGKQHTVHELKLLRKNDA